MFRRMRNSSMRMQYTALFFAGIMLVSVVVACCLLRFSADGFQQYELGRVETSMRQAVSDLESQSASLTDIALNIKVTNSYNPGMLRRDAYQEIRLLEDFIHYKNYSPLLEDYFLLYQHQRSEWNKIFTSEGKTSYFEYYMASKLGLASHEVSALHDYVAGVETTQCLVVGSKVLMLVPIRFVATVGPVESAVAGFVMPVQAIRERILRAGANLPGNLMLQWYGQTLCITGEALEPSLLETSGVIEQGGAYQIGVHSSGGEVRLATRITQSKWSLLLGATSGYQLMALILILVAVCMLAFGLAEVTMKPLRSILKQRMSPDQRLRNEFSQLEELLGSMERENANSMSLLRSRFLQAILSGYYSENLIDNWNILHISFTKPYYRVAVLDTYQLSSREAETMASLAEQCADGQSQIYAVYMPEDNVLGVIVGYDSPEAEQLVLGRLQELAACRYAEWYIGQACDSPQMLPISYMEAMTAYERAQKWQAGGQVDMRGFARQLVEAAERGDEEGMRLMCAQLSHQAEVHQPAKTLLNAAATQLSLELSLMADKRHLSLDRERLSMLAMLPRLNLVLSEAFEVVRENFFCEQEAAPSRMDQAAQSIVAYVQENACDADFDLSSLAERFGLSNDYITRMIKRVTGASFKEYLTELRMSRACELLRDNDAMTVNEISEAVGYRKASNFIKKFKEIYGCTPAQYRRYS